MNPAAPDEMGLGRPAARPYRLAPQRGPDASSALRRETYSVAEVAALLGRSRSFTHDLIKEGRLRAFRLSKRVIVVRPADLADFLDRLEEG